MFEEDLAHSANEKGIGRQSQVVHGKNVYTYAMTALECDKIYIPTRTYEIISAILSKATPDHDIGKSIEEDQMILHGVVVGKMPNHTEGGVCFYLRLRRLDNLIVAFLIKSHHLPMRNFTKNPELLRDKANVTTRSPHLTIDGSVAELFDAQFEKLVTIRDKIDVPRIDINLDLNEVSAFHIRLMLSYLVEADHNDTAANYENPFVPATKSLLLPAKRSLVLDNYVSTLSHGSEKRKFIRKTIYEASKNSPIEAPFTSLTSEVGTAKTVACVAYSLARKNKPASLVYCASMCAILNQNSGTAKQLILPEESFQKTVAICHHENEYEDEEGFQKRDARLYSHNFHPPIIVTTTVQLIETWASNRPSKLKKFHRLAGAHIIIDEAHICAPVYLWPFILMACKFFAQELGCKFTFVSGTMIKFWEWPEFREAADFHYDVIPIIPPEISAMTLAEEIKRVGMEYYPDPFVGPTSFCQWTLKYPGSKMVVVDTIKNWAMICHKYLQLLPQEDVVAISNALTANDKDRILNSLFDEDGKCTIDPHSNKTLIGTSCIQTGINLSCLHGFGENAGMMNASQLSGRLDRDDQGWGSVNRIFELDVDSPNAVFTKNSDYDESRKALRKLANQRKLGPQYCEEAVREEFASGTIHTGNVIPSLSGGASISYKELLSREKKRKFEDVASYVKVICQNKTTVIIEEENLADEPTDSDIARNSIEIYSDKIPKLGNLIGPSQKVLGMLAWKGAYDHNFFGYMDPRNGLF